jgi:hypothetical protein
MVSFEGNALMQAVDFGISYSVVHVARPPRSTSIISQG